GKVQAVPRTARHHPHARKPSMRVRTRNERRPSELRYSRDGGRHALRRVLRCAPPEEGRPRRGSPDGAVGLCARPGQAIAGEGTNPPPCPPRPRAPGDDSPSAAVTRHLHSPRNAKPRQKRGFVSPDPLTCHRGGPLRGGRAPSRLLCTRRSVSPGTSLNKPPLFPFATATSMPLQVIDFIARDPEHLHRVAKRALAPAAIHRLNVG